MTPPHPEGLYILLISIHGLIRGRNLELGRDADTGGQTRYVVELARALGRLPRVGRVDLMTRRIDDPAVGPDYARAIEPIAPGVNIVRVPAGPGDYIRKELLWDHLDAFVDNAAMWLRTQPRLPDVIHGHYADAGYASTHLSKLLGRPLVFTSHSLGRVKRLRLLAAGLSREDIETRYAMRRRIAVEEETLSNADLVVASTHNEVTEQYELYDCYHPGSMTVIPPGVDLERFRPPAGDETKTPLFAEIARFLRRPRKPMILAVARPDERKNLPALVTAFGQSAGLRRRANLAIVAGTRDDIRTMDAGPQDVLKDLLLAIDRHDLYGKVALPKAVTAVPLMYRIAAATRGVFVNPALTEPFGLTLLEAAASGLPVVATRDGGPTDIIGNCENGRLVDPLDIRGLGRALYGILGNPGEWDRLSGNGIANVARLYSWQAHAESYFDRLSSLLGGTHPARISRKRHSVYADRALIADLDQVLLGDDEALARLSVLLRENRKTLVFGISTGRAMDSALRVIRKTGIPAPELLITATGTEIHLGPDLIPDDWWTRHIDHQWNPRAVRRILQDVDGLVPQPQEHQTPFRVSYFLDPARAPRLHELRTWFYQAEINVNVRLSFGQFLDILPARASKGLALRHAAHQLDIPLERILVAGGSGSDIGMMRGNTMGAVIANRHAGELAVLPPGERLFRTSARHAGGILEAVAHFDLLGACAPPGDEEGVP